VVNWGSAKLVCESTMAAAAGMDVMAREGRSGLRGEKIEGKIELYTGEVLRPTTGSRAPVVSPRTAPFTAR
jgi:hypothetical protein